MEWNWTTVFMEPVQGMLRQAGEGIPALAGTLLILIIGWLLAKIIEVAVTKALKIARFDIAACKVGISNTLNKGGIKYTPAELIGILVYWLVMFIVFATAINTLGLEIAAEMFQEILRYIPNVIAAIFVFVLGMFLASFVAKIVSTTSSKAGIAQAKILGDITQYIIIFFAAIIALGHLKIEIEIIKLVISCLVAGMCLAFGLAFGLGCKEIAGDLAKKLLSKYTKQE